MGNRGGVGDRRLKLVAVYGMPALKLGMLEQVEHSKDRLLLPGVIAAASTCSFGCQATALSLSACMVTGAQDLQEAATQPSQDCSSTRMQPDTIYRHGANPFCLCHRSKLGHTLASSSSQARQGFRSTVQHNAYQHCDITDYQHTPHTSLQTASVMDGLP